MMRLSISFVSTKLRSHISSVIPVQAGMQQRQTYREQPATKQSLVVRLGLFLFIASIMSNAFAADITSSQALIINSAISRQSSSVPASSGLPEDFPAVSAVPTVPVSPAVSSPSVSQWSSPSFTPNGAQAAFYSSNQNSNVFGANLFTGAFARLGPTQFNPDYSVALGDSIEVRLWGSFLFDQILNVDPEGNIYLPNVGPVHVLGVRNKDIQYVVESAIAKVYRSNVLSYSTLAAAQPVRVFVGGYVNLPGMYSGTSMDSLLSYLDQAGGIDPARGSFLNVQVKRGNQIRATFNLYDFLLEGRMPLVQLADGDIILVSTLQHTFTVSSMAQNAKQFEFDASGITMSDVVKLAKPLPQANHVMVTHNNSSRIQNTDYYTLSEANQVPMQNGDVIQFTSDKKIGTISVRVQGEHESEIAYVIPYGSRLGDLMKKIKYSERSDASDIQLFRLSVQATQKQQLQTLLQNLQANVLSARSGTAAEEVLRTQEAKRMLQWISYANQIQPTGQVLIAQNTNRDDLLLENGDVINIPTKRGLVNVNGQVSFPTSIAFEPGLKIDDYIRMCGGYLQSPNVARVIVAHLDGSFSDITSSNDSGSRNAIREGDTIMVLPYADPKTREFWLEMTQIIAQVAITAKVVLGL